MERLDRTAFRIASFDEADNNTAYWLTRPVRERLRAADILLRQAYNIPKDQVLRLDRTHAAIRCRYMSNNIFNRDFQDLIHAFNKHDVRYMLVGGYAVIVHGYSRSTGDMDLWVDATKENYRAIASAFASFGMPLFDMTEQKFLQTQDYDVFTFGVPPVAIDLITKLKGLTFTQAYGNSSYYEFDDLSVRVIQYGDLITTKRAAGRNRDLNDVERLEKGRE